MSNILIDNWNMENIAYELSYIPDEYFSYAYGELLNATVLWDEVYYLNNDWSWNWINSQQELTKIVTPINDDLSFLQESEEIYKKYFENKEYLVVASGAIRYSLFSNRYGMGYLPCEERSNFLNNVDVATRKKIFKNVLYNRQSSLNILDELIEEQFSSIKRFFPELKINFQYPVLVDYIRFNANSKKSCIDVALQLKREKAVMAYREYMDQFELALENEQWSTVIKFEKEIQEIVNDMLKIPEGRAFTVSGSISLMPSIDISTEIVLNRKKYHLNFLRELADFSFSGKRKLTNR